jgi:hypothetical protein
MQYGIYAITFWSSLLLPRFISRTSITQLSHKFTISFSNTAGPLKPFEYQGQKGGKIVKNISSQSYIQVAGRVGFALTIVS